MDRLAMLPCRELLPDCNHAPFSFTGYDDDAERVQIDGRLMQGADSRIGSAYLHLEMPAMAEIDEGSSGILTFGRSTRSSVLQLRTVSMPEADAASYVDQVHPSA